jgi:hypothetical protein
LPEGKGKNTVFLKVAPGGQLKNEAMVSILVAPALPLSRNSLEYSSIKKTLSE